MPAFLIAARIKEMLKFYNTLGRKKQVFRPIKKGTVGLYTCGPTVYDHVHIGNLRTYVFEDLLRRTLEASGYSVRQVMNITDIEDKIIKRANIEKKDFREITEKYTTDFFNDIRKLNIEKAEFFPKATDHIQEMIGLITILVKKGIAYQGTDGSVYFSIAKFKSYGKLSDLKKREIMIGSRIAADEYNKEDAQDFVLWKTKKDNEPFWPSPWGNGRPGWHIECSAMSMKYLGKTFDIHTGGVDNIFPHHENEIAQSEAATGKTFVKYWLHGEHLLVQGQKMSKSLNNFYTLKDLEEKEINPLAFRYLCLLTHYRTKLNFTWESLKAAETALNNLYAQFNELPELPAEKKLSLESRKILKLFVSAAEDDLGLPKAVAILWKTLKDRKLNNAEKKSLIIHFDGILGLRISENTLKNREIPTKIKDLAEKRELLRANKQFIQADALRKELERLGYKVEDNAGGPVITKESNI